MRFYTFRAWAQEMGVPEDDINAAYDPEQVGNTHKKITELHHLKAKN